MMRPIRVPTTRVDDDVAGAIAHNVGPTDEALLQTLTWGADEHLLIAAAAAFWLLSCYRKPAQRYGSHLLATSVVTGVLPHLFKRTCNQWRPDRLTVIGHLHGVPFSGRADDAFPSGHAVHMGALASAATAFPKPYRQWTLAAAIGLSLTRIGVLAHWASDVVVGFAGGFIVERLLRVCTGYPAKNHKHDDTDCQHG